MLNVGYRPTVDDIGHELSIEAHLLNFDEDIYDQHVRLVILKRIRDERRMNSLQELSSQLAVDMRDVATGHYVVYNIKPNILQACISKIKETIKH